jgi:hypothetical protein
LYSGGPATAATEKARVPTAARLKLARAIKWIVKTFRL